MERHTRPVIGRTSRSRVGHVTAEVEQRDSDRVLPFASLCLCGAEKVQDVIQQRGRPQQPERALSLPLSPSVPLSFTLIELRK